MEVSLYDLLREHFSGDMDAREAELELGRFRWKPFDRDDKGMNVIVFWGHVERLMKRAGLTLSFPRIRAIRNCLPPRFKDRVEMETSETRLWDQINKTYVTMEIDYIDKQCASCGKSGHTADVCRSSGAQSRKKDSTTAAPASSPAVCSHCHRPGHLEPSCWAKYGRPSSDTRAKGPPVPVPANGQSRPAAAATPAAASNNWRAPDLKQSTLSNYVKVRRTCFRCGAEGHVIRDCVMNPPLPVPEPLMLLLVVYLAWSLELD